jgi:hypothetical protein
MRPTPTMTPSATRLVAVDRFARVEHRRYRTTRANGAAAAAALIRHRVRSLFVTRSAGITGSSEGDARRSSGSKASGSSAREGFFSTTNGSSSSSRMKSGDGTGGSLTSSYPSGGPSSRERRSGGNGGKSSSSSSSNKKSALELALANIFDDGDDDAKAQERMRWKRLVNAMWRALLVLFIAPFVVAQSVKSVMVTPWLGAHWNNLNSSLTNEQQANVARGIESFEQRARLDRIMAGAKKPAEDVERELLRAEAKRLGDLERKKSFEATGNVIGSLIFITMTVTIITLQKKNISRLLDEIGDEFIGLDAATQAFILMLGADMVVGYHSSDGWQALLACVITHYGFDFHRFEMAVRIFVAVVPVTLDIGFKYWVFNRLRKISPSTQIILGEIERH